MIVDTDNLLTVDMAAYEMGLTRRALLYRIERSELKPDTIICGKQYFFRSTVKDFVKYSRSKKP